MNTIENNKIIAEFLGFQETKIGWFDNEEVLIKIEKDNTFDLLKFDFDWNWLIVLTEKIFEIEEKIQDDLIFKLNDSILELNKDSLYNSCINCINYYNQQNEKPC